MKQVLFNSSKLQIATDIIAIYFGVWFNDWPSVFWFGPVALINIAFEIYFTIDYFGDLPPINIVF